MNYTINDIILYLLGVIIIIISFLIFRAIILWYWKVNEIVKLLKEIRDNTKKEKIEDKERQKN